jgi:signal transduction histidine kinase
MISFTDVAAKSRGPQSHSRVYLVYFVLASFDILVVLAGLLLSSHFASVFEKTVEYRQGWDKIFSQMWRISDLVTDTGEPVIDMFETADWAGNSKKFEETLKALSKEVGSLQQELIETGRAEAAQDALAALLVVQNTLKLVAEHGRSALSNYRDGWIDKAAHCMSMTHGYSHKLKHQFQGAMASIQLLARNYENQKLDEVRELRRYELLIAFCVLFMVAGVTTYGHHIGRLIKRSHRQLTEAYEHVEESRADTLAHAERLQAVNEDVTRLNQELAVNMKHLQDAQEENIRKGKLAQLGQLTALVAHEIRNPLNIIRTAAYLAERKLDGKSHELEMQFGRITKGVTRCDSIISELLDFTRMRTLQLETVEIDEWLKELVTEQAQKLPPAVKVEYRPGLPHVTARFDPSRMYRLVVNFLTNASEAMVGNGEDTGKFTTPSPRIIVATAKSAGGIEITCADNGPGISEENLKKIREPLFTTKSFGIGLGLPAIDRILDEHGGKLRIETKLGEGTRMTAWIPLRLDQQEAA